MLILKRFQFFQKMFVIDKMQQNPTKKLHVKGMSSNWINQNTIFVIDCAKLYRREPIFPFMAIFSFACKGSFVRLISLVSLLITLFCPGFVFERALPFITNTAAVESGCLFEGLFPIVYCSMT